jgi:hypothetical protein
MGLKFYADINKIIECSKIKQIGPAARLNNRLRIPDKNFFFRWFPPAFPSCYRAPPRHPAPGIIAAGKLSYPGAAAGCRSRRNRLRKTRKIIK